MMNLIFFDTETTGNTEKDHLIQFAYKMGDSANADGASETFCELYKAPVKIPPEASAVHHITNKMIADKPTFKESPDYIKIKKLFENEGSVVVAHNATFDLMIIEKEDIKPKKFICTLRVARHLDQEEKIERYNLQYLRYLLELEVEALAHNALGDVLVLEQLFLRLKKKIMESGDLNEEEAIEKMVEISSHPSLIRKMNFGKHVGKLVEEVLVTDRGYLEWLLAQKLESDQIDEDWIYTLKHHLARPPKP